MPLLPPFPPEVTGPEQFKPVTQPLARWADDLLRFLRDAVGEFTLGRISQQIGAGAASVTALAARVAALESRAKDIYTFPLGTVAVTEDLPGYAISPLEVAANGTVQEVKFYGQTPAVGAITVQVAVGAVLVATLTVPDGGLRATALPGIAVLKDQRIAVAVVAAEDEPGLDDAVVQVLVV
jgi:hypothetical protein